MDNMTFEKIIEKTKKMLGKNYRGDTEIVPVQSEFAPIEGHTDSFLVVSNGGLTNDEITLIKDKTKNYAWWVANKGYLVDDTQREIPALFIYGSEIGSITPDVLNFNGVTENNFYMPINKTDMMGNISVSTSHLFIQYILDEEIQEYETDQNGINTEIEIGDTKYKIYSGRLYPEDRQIIEGNVVYPIYLVSNLNYYNISEAENLNGSHDMELTEKNNLEILEEVCDMVINEAAQWTNRFANEKLLNECWPVIVKCACIAYLNRGGEGLKSQSELGQQNVYNDWVALMHQQITNRRYIL